MHPTNSSPAGESAWVHGILAPPTRGLPAAKNRQRRVSLWVHFAGFDRGVTRLNGGAHQQRRVGVVERIDSIAVSATLPWAECDSERKSGKGGYQELNWIGQCSSKGLNMSQKPPTTERRLLTRKDVARRMSVHTNSVKNWQRKGQIAAVIINSRVVRYEESEVERLIQESRLASSLAGGAR